jgi:hypothetical protein
MAEATRVVRGWAGYFYFQHCVRDFSALRWFIEERVRIYVRRKHHPRSRGYRAVPYELLYGRLELYRLPMRAPGPPPTSAGR